MKKKIVIVGSGMAGGILANELVHGNFEVTVIDLDLLSESYDNELQPKLDVANTYYQNEKPVGYGFGGTSNLWHGVIGEFDDIDWKTCTIEDKIKVSIRNSLNEQIDNLQKYFGSLDELYKINSRDLKQARRLIRHNGLNLKKYLVLKKPLRTRKIIQTLASSNLLNIIEQATVIDFHINEFGQIVSLRYRQDGKIKEIQSDVYLVCAGALETPRIIRSLASNKVDKYPLLEHPQVLLGRVRYKKRVLYNLIGLSKPFISSARRIGFKLNDNVLSAVEHRNMSIFLRPDFELDDTLKRSALKKVLYEPKLRDIFIYLSKTRGAWRVILELALEKFGLGFYTRRLAIYAQYEQTPKDGNYIKFSDEYQDEQGRCVPIVNAPNGLFNKSCHDNLKDILSRAIIDGDIDFIPYEKLEPITGAHFSGTVPLGTTVNDVIDTDLKVKGYDRVYVCDASIFPFIGNVNLSLNIAKFALRLASYLKSRTEY